MKLEGGPLNTDLGLGANAVRLGSYVNPFSYGPEANSLRFGPAADPFGYGPEATPDQRH